MNEIVLANMNQIVLLHLLINYKDYMIWKKNQTTRLIDSIYVTGHYTKYSLFLTHPLLEVE